MARDIKEVLYGGRELRRHKGWDRVPGELSVRPPKNITVNDNNVALPAVASLAALAAGALGTLTLTAQRDCILRELLLDAYDAAAAVGSAREGNIVLTGLTVAGENCFAGNGELPGRMFFPDAFGRPEFDMPINGGTSVVVSVVNRSASVAGTDVSAGAKID